MIRPGQIASGLRRLETGGERPDRIGAGIDRHFGIEPQQLAPHIGVGLDLVVMLARIGAGDQMLATILGPAKRRLVGPASHATAISSGCKQAFVSEAAA